VTRIQLGGTKYVEGCIVALDSSEILPIFGIVLEILLVKENNPYFVCEVVTTQEFSNHLHAFVIKEIYHLQSHFIPYLRTI